MKFTAALSSLLVILPLLVSAAPPKGGFNGGFGGAKGGQNNAGGGAAAGGKGASSTSVAASVAATVAASSVAASSTVAAAPPASSSAAGNGTDSGDIQSSLTLDPSVLATGFEQDGQQTPTAGQVASLTSSDNFINFCATVPNLPITNGEQVVAGSCNPAPMGIIAAQTKMPSAKFVIPANGQTLPANQAFTITMAINNLGTGNFVNADTNYFAAPQQVNSDGVVEGHSHVVVEALTSLAQTTPTDPTVFAFFKGMNEAAVNGQLTADVTAGLPAGFYKVSSINTAANHQPVLVSVAQHGALDDCVYFTVSDDGAAANSTASNSTAAAPPAAANSTIAASSALPAASSAAAAGGAKAPAPAKGASPAKAPAPAKGNNAGKGQGRLTRRFARESY